MRPSPGNPAPPQRGGSSLPAIKKAIAAKHPKADPKRVTAAIKKLIADKALEQVGSGAHCCLLGRSGRLPWL